MAPVTGVNFLTQTQPVKRTEQPVQQAEQPVQQAEQSEQIQRLQPIGIKPLGEKGTQGIKPAGENPLLSKLNAYDAGQLTGFNPGNAPSQANVGSQPNFAQYDTINSPSQKNHETLSRNLDFMS